MSSVQLREVAHSRSGDKGNLNSLSVIAYDPRLFDWLAAELTADRVKAHLAFRVTGRVQRYEWRSIAAVHFVVEKAVTDTVTTSTFADTHGKSLSSALLELRLEVPEELLPDWNGVPRRG